MMQSKEKEKRRCANPKCGKSFSVFRKWAKYCSSKCRLEHWQARHPRVQASELRKMQQPQGEAAKRNRPVKSQEIITRLDRIERALNITNEEA